MPRKSAIAVLALAVGASAAFSAAPPAANAPTTQPMVTISTPESRLAARKQALQNQIRDMNWEIADLTAEYNQQGLSTSPGALQQVSTQMDNQLASIEVSIAGKTARVKFLEQKVAGMVAAAQEHVANDPVLAELKKAADAREQSAKFAQQKEAIGGDRASTEEGVAVAAEARARVDQRREQLMAAANDEYNAIKREIVELNADLQEQQAMVNKIHDLLKKNAQNAHQINLLDQKEGDLAAALEELRALEFGARPQK